VQDPLAEMILGGEITDGSQVPVTVESGRLLVGNRPSQSEAGNGSPRDRVIVNFPKSG